MKVYLLIALVFCFTTLLQANTVVCLTDKQEAWVEAELIKGEQAEVEVRYNQAGNFENYQKIPAEYLERYKEMGRELYVEKGEFKFQMTRDRTESGVLNAGVFRAQYAGKRLFVKKLKSGIEQHELLEDIQNAKLLEASGLGPKIDLVEIGPRYYLVMEELSGINLKDILDTLNGNSTTQSRIETLLGAKTKNRAHAAKLLAQEIIFNQSYLIRLKDMVEELKALGFKDVQDLQIMVDPRVGANSLKIIDSELFSRFPAPGDNMGPAEAIQNLIDKLKHLAG